MPPRPSHSLPPRSDWRPRMYVSPLSVEPALVAASRPKLVVTDASSAAFSAASLPARAAQQLVVMPPPLLISLSPSLTSQWNQRQPRVDRRCVLAAPSAAPPPVRNAAFSRVPSCAATGGTLCSPRRAWPCKGRPRRRLGASSSRPRPNLAPNLTPRPPSPSHWGHWRCARAGLGDAYSLGRAASSEPASHAPPSQPPAVRCVALCSRGGGPGRAGAAPPWASHVPRRPARCRHAALRTHCRLAATGATGAPGCTCRR